jgi:dTDP-4-dehydrorhamnose reductase
LKALIFGATGQVGAALAACVPQGVELVALDRRASDFARDGDVERAVNRAQPDLVINAAAYTAVDRAETEESLAERINGVAPGRIAAAAKDCGARFIHISTDFVFDGSGSHPYLPEDQAAPLGAYGRTKLAGERAVAASYPKALIVRTAWVYAARGTNFLNTMLRLMRERDEIAVVDDQVGTPTYVRSLAVALWKLSAMPSSGVLHYTDSGVASWYDFAVAIAEEGAAAGLLDRPVTVRPIASKDYPTPAHRPAYSVLDKRTTWELLGKAAPHWRACLREAIGELKADG